MVQDQIWLSVIKPSLPFLCSFYSLPLFPLAAALGKRNTILTLLWSCFPRSQCLRSPAWIHCTFLFFFMVIFLSFLLYSLSSSVFLPFLFLSVFLFLPHPSFPPPSPFFFLPPVWFYVYVVMSLIRMRNKVDKPYFNLRENIVYIFNAPCGSNKYGAIWERSINWSENCCVKGKVHLNFVKF